MRYNSKRPSSRRRAVHEHKVSRRYVNSKYHIAHDLRDRLHHVKHELQVLKRQLRWINSSIKRAQKKHERIKMEEAASWADTLTFPYEPRNEKELKIDRKRASRAHRHWARFLLFAKWRRARIRELLREAADIQGRLEQL